MFPFYLSIYLFIYISGPIPDGADSVVQVEDTEKVTDTLDGSKRVNILVQVPPGLDIRNMVYYCNSFYFFILLLKFIL